MSDAFEDHTRHRSGLASKRNALVALVVAVVALLLVIVFTVGRPALPIATTFRPAFDGNSQVAQFHNTGNKYLAVQATFENAGLKQRRQTLLNIGPYQTVEYGWLEGWSFMSGEHVSLVSDGYRTSTVEVP